jgi:hypothetical protein
LKNPLLGAESIGTDNHKSLGNQVNSQSGNLASNQSYFPDVPVTDGD